MSTVANAKAAMGYTPPRQRPACRNCWSGHELTGSHAADWRCAKGGFYVAPLAVCEHYSPRHQGGESGESGQEAA